MLITILRIFEGCYNFTDYIVSRTTLTSDILDYLNKTNWTMSDIIHIQSIRLYNTALIPNYQSS